MMKHVFKHLVIVIDSVLWRGIFLIGTLLAHSFLLILIRNISISFQIMQVHSKYVFHFKKHVFVHICCCCFFSFRFAFVF